MTAALRAARQRSLAGLAEACRVSLDHPSFLVRVETIRLLGELGDRRLVPYLVQKLSDSEAVVRGYAARSLGKLSDRRALGYLTARYMREEVPEVKMAIKKAIERINGFPMSE